MAVDAGTGPSPGQTLLARRVPPRLARRAPPRPGAAPRVREVQRSAATERLSALSDGVFAIAMTLLVLDISVPDGLDDAGFRAALRDTGPHLAAYALSFAVIAQFWRSHRALLAQAPGDDETVTRFTLLGLALVALLPFPTGLVAEYGDQPLAAASYAANVAAANAAHLGVLGTSHRRAGPPPDDGRAAERRRSLRVLTALTSVFAVSIPVALVSPGLAPVLWVSVFPLQWLLTRDPANGAEGRVSRWPGRRRGRR
ncbi:DUF1211 domain-containing protein [Streptomyces sp. 3MP-14]|uniref:DUF1211 domain-containing protein n=1 Tax=Streptomyces mimosae TaxID=2586635 RepID=A0A5N6AS75_9ACTN|nr:DUF1211 domain-containing protein [Streptomyces mimosae]KAB8179687.1 DUF1211 domain-containing protein [Streptomyces sp. 3MP-14]